MFEDYHVHLDKVDWSVDTIKEMCKIAKSRGVDRLGLVVHTRALEGFKPLYHDIIADGKSHSKFKFDRSMDQYMDTLVKAKAEGCPVDIGLEVCYSPEGESFLKKKLKEYPLDFVIGSIHLIEGMHYKTALEKYNDTNIVGKLYYNLVLDAIESGLFDIIGHIEVVRREGILGLDHFPDILKNIADSMNENDCALEINTKWLVKRDYIVPDCDTLKYMESKGIKLVFGSDAHHMDRIGFEKDTAFRAIQNAGYNGFAYLGPKT
jgi:histidinol-phosphatase (PHP family)